MIYFVRREGEGLIKIGYSWNPKQRYLTLRAGSPERLNLVATMHGNRVDEAALHSRFSASHVAGEWFRPSPDLLSFIEGSATRWIDPIPPAPPVIDVSITTEHPRSSYGIPVILDDSGEPLDYAPGIKAIRARLGLSTAQLGEAVGKSRRTVEDYEQGRRGIPAEVLNVLAGMLPTGRRRTGAKGGRPR